MTERVRLSRLVQVFGWTGLTSLGGGRSAYFYDAVVHKRPWLKSSEFIQDLTISQLLPGPSFANLGVALGVRLGGGSCENSDRLREAAQTVASDTQGVAARA